MPVMNIVLNLEGEGAGRDMTKQIHLKNPITVGCLPYGMESGAPSVAFIFDLPDGQWVFAETSLTLLLSAADAFRARYGDPREKNRRS